TSSPFRPCCFRSSSSSSLSNMIVGELSISTSHLIPEQNGPHNKSLRRSRSTAHRNICYEIAIRSTDRNSANRSKSWTSKKSSARQGSPWQRAYVERVIGSIRRECLDHVIVVGEESLRCALRSYFAYYHRARLHLSLDRDSPDSRSVESVG